MRVVAIILIIILVVLLVFKSYERDRIVDWAKWRFGPTTKSMVRSANKAVDWFEDLSEFKKVLLGAAAFTLLTLAFTYLTAPWIEAILMRWF